MADVDSNDGSSETSSISDIGVDLGSGPYQNEPVAQENDPYLAQMDVQESHNEPCTNTFRLGNTDWYLNFTYMYMYINLNSYLLK